MSKKKEVHEWLKNNQPQLLWAKEYLQKKNIPLSTERGYEQALTEVRRLDKETIRLMRLAWNATSSKNQRGKKTRSFTLSDEAVTVLRQMAGNQAQSQKLEELILTIDKAKDNERQKLKDKHALDMLKQRKAIGMLIEALKEWAALTEQALLESSRLKVLLEDNRIESKNPSEEQLKRALPIFNQATQPIGVLKKKQEKAEKLLSSPSLFFPLSKLP